MTLCWRASGHFWNSTWNDCHYPVTQEQYFMVEHIQCHEEPENECLVEGESICQRYYSSSSSAVWLEFNSSEFQFSEFFQKASQVQVPPRVSVLV